MKLLYLVESGKSKFLVFDEMPDKISTKYGDDTIIGRIGGIFYDFLAKRNERREAFGGRKFDIVLDNGEVEKCEGQWWDAVTDRAREELEKEGNSFSEMMLIGISSVDRLLDCYVYCGLWASKSKVEEMVADYKGRIYVPCGADKCPECGENGTLRWVDEERQEIDAKGLDCLGYVRELRVDDYLSPTTLEEIAEEIKKKVNRG